MIVRIDKSERAAHLTSDVTASSAETYLLVIDGTAYSPSQIGAEVELIAATAEEVFALFRAGFTLRGSAEFFADIEQAQFLVDEVRQQLLNATDPLPLDSTNDLARSLLVALDAISRYVKSGTPNQAAEKNRRRNLETLTLVIRALDFMSGELAEVDQTLFDWVQLQRQRLQGVAGTLGNEEDS